VSWPRKAGLECWVEEIGWGGRWLSLGWDRFLVWRMGLCFKSLQTADTRLLNPGLGTVRMRDFTAVITSSL
jgi:hypothetical protein